MKRLAFLFLCLAGCGETAAPPEEKAAAREEMASPALQNKAGLPDVMAADVPAPQPNQAQLREEHLERMKASIRLYTISEYQRHCGLIWLPESAFEPVEINGGGMPEVAVFHDAATCTEMGATGFHSTGGAIVQFWHMPEDRGPRLALSTAMMGFTPGHRQVVTREHGSSCGLPGAAGCRVTYRWSDLGRLEVAEKLPGNKAPRWERMAFSSERDGDQLIPVDGRRTPKQQLARMRAHIRQDVQLNYGERCGPITLPDSAFFEVELSGDDLPEYAVSLGKARCWAGGENTLQGNGGPIVQFWHMDRDHDRKDGPIRLLFEAPVRGFTPTKDGLVVIQHHAFCEPVQALGFCRADYRWHARSGRLDAVKRADTQQGPQDMKFGDEELG